MKINLNGRNIVVTIWQKDDDEYMYYIGNRLIGSLKTSAMINENIIMKPKSIVSSLEKLGVRIKNENELQNTDVSIIDVNTDVTSELQKDNLIRVISILTSQIGERIENVFGE